MPKTEYRAVLTGPCTDRDGYWPKAHRVMATEQRSHSQVWDKYRSMRFVNRWDDLAHMRARRGGPNVVRYQSKGITVTRIIK